MDYGIPVSTPWPEVDHGAIETEAQALRALPQFNGEFVGLLIELIGHYADRPELHVVMNDRGRFLVMLAAHLLHHAPDEKGHRLSKARLSTYCHVWNICSRGRARAIGSALRWAGFLEAGPAIEDGRSRPIVPTAELDRLLISLWHRLAEMIARLNPELGQPLFAIDDHAFAQRAECALISLNFSGYRLLDHAPRLRALSDRNAGLAIAVFASISITGGGPPPSIASMARQFGVSRAHVRQIIQIAEIEGLLACDAQPTPPLEEWPLFDECANLAASLLVILIKVGSEPSSVAKRQRAVARAR